MGARGIERGGRDEEEEGGEREGGERVWGTRGGERV